MSAKPKAGPAGYSGATVLMAVFKCQCNFAVVIEEYELQRVEELMALMRWMMASYRS